MDPNAALETLREITEAILDNADEQTSDMLIEIAETFQGLDQWLSRAGYPPDPWQR